MPAVNATRSEARPPRVKPEHVLPEVEALLARAGSSDGAPVAENGELPAGLDLPELRELLDGLHPADIADVLEALPLRERLIAWDHAPHEADGEVLLEVSDAVRGTLIEHMDRDELVAAMGELDPDEIADLKPDLPQDVLIALMQALPPDEREQVRSALSYPEDTVGALMDFDMVTVRENITLETALRYLRRLEEMPDQTDQLFVVDRARRLHGVLSLNRILVNDTDTRVGTLMEDARIILHPRDGAHTAAQAFERYDLVSAPVVDSAGRLVGRVTVDAVLDYIRDESEAEQLSAGGLLEDEDLFGPLWKSIRNRWLWLAVNLVTAFIASRVIGLFEGSIHKIVALAALMPIIAGIGGNSGNQTITMIVRALATGQVTAVHARKLFAKEIGVAALNGLVWGCVVGVFAWAIYDSVPLGAVMTAAMMLNLLLAAIMGVTIPLLMQKLGRDPAVGSSVMITAITDSGGFFIFLGLATLFLV